MKKCIDNFKEATEIMKDMESNYKIDSYDIYKQNTNIPEISKISKEDLDLWMGAISCFTMYNGQWETEEYKESLEYIKHIFKPNTTNNYHPILTLKKVCKNEIILHKFRRIGDNMYSQKVYCNLDESIRKRSKSQTEPIREEAYFINHRIYDLLKSGYTIEKDKDENQEEE